MYILLSDIRHGIVVYGHPRGSEWVEVTNHGLLPASGIQLFLGRGFTAADE
jgi:hypothetical protein